MLSTPASSQRAECPLCICEFEGGSVSLRDCGHTLCVECALGFLARPRLPSGAKLYRAACPVCRMLVLTAPGPTPSLAPFVAPSDNQARHPPVKTTAVAVAELIKDAPSLRLLIADKGSFEAIFDQLTARVRSSGPAAAADVVKSLTGALHAAVPPNGTASGLPGYSAYGRPLVAACCKVSSAAMASHPRDANVQEAGCLALEAAASRLRRRDIGPSLCVAGVTAPEAVLSALTRHIDSAAVSRAALRALRALCKSAEGVPPAAGLRVLRCGGLGALAACLGNSTTSAEYTWCMEVIKSLLPAMEAETAVRLHSLKEVLEQIALDTFTVFGERPADKIRVPVAQKVLRDADEVIRTAYEDLARSAAAARAGGGGVQALPPKRPRLEDARTTLNEVRTLAFDSWSVGAGGRSARAWWREWQQRQQ